MSDSHWLSAVYFFVLESLIESAIIFLIVRAVLRWRGLHNAATVSRFLLLPLAIPVLLTPVLHLLVPQLEQLALIVQIERTFPVLETMRHSNESLAPALLLVFFALLGINLAQWLIISLREIVSSAPTPHMAHRADVDTTLARLAQQVGVTQPRYVVSKRHRFAAHVFGWRRPTISLGQYWLARLDADELEAVLAHELAHFKRGDTWHVLIAKVCRDLMFFNPLAHIIYARFVAAREEAADDHALCITRKPLALASCLLKFWRAQQTAPAATVGLSVMGQPAGLERRIRRLVTDSYVYQPDRDPDGLFYGLSIVLTIVLSIV